MKMCAKLLRNQGYFKAKSSNQSIFLVIEKYDPGHKWFYGTIGSDYPRGFLDLYSIKQPKVPFPAHIEYSELWNIKELFYC